MIDEKKPEAPAAPRHAGDSKPAETEKPERTIVLGKIKTDEEARLAAEIEKLRG